MSRENAVTPVSCDAYCECCDVILDPRDDGQKMCRECRGET